MSLRPSTALTIRRRQGYKTTDIFDSRYIFVTGNTTFSGAIRRFLRDNFYYNSRQAPSVISLKELAAKVWMEVGNKERSDRFKIPRSQLLLSCDRALRFNRQVVQKAKDELSKISVEQLAQFELLLEVPRSARAVMDFTLNDERYISGDTIGQLVEAAVEAAGVEVGEKERAKRAKDRERHERELAEVLRQLDLERSKSRQAAIDLASKQRDERDMVDALTESAVSRHNRLLYFARIFSGSVVIVPLMIALVKYWGVSPLHT